jgi:hypothetical protein
MATDDGRMGGEDRRDDPPTDPPSVADEPTLLPYDWPEPASWDTAMGAGGEPLREPAELVALDAPDEEGAAPTIYRARRRRWRLRGVPRARGALGGVRLPSPGTLAASASVAGLVTLIGLNVLVLTSSGGGDPVPPDETPNIASASPGVAPGADAWIRAAKDVEDRIQAAALERRREAARERAEARARRRARPAPARERTVVTTPVSAPVSAASTPPPAPSPAVSPAEREFTPGPWNLQ